MKHPLTDKICRDLAGHMIYYSPTVQRNDMRAAYDLGVQAGCDKQLRQVLEWLDEYGQDYFDHYSHELHALLGDLLVAMRPQENG